MAFRHYRHRNAANSFAVLLLVALSACSSAVLPATGVVGDVSLPFETIEAAPVSGYTSRDPRVYLIDTPDAVEPVKHLISPEAVERLLAMDFQDSFALAVFRGQQTFAGGYEHIIERVALRGEQVVVSIHFQTYPIDPRLLSTIHSAYQVVEVRKVPEIGEPVDLVVETRTVTPTPQS